MHRSQAQCGCWGYRGKSQVCAKTRWSDLLQNEWLLLAHPIIQPAAPGVKESVAKGCLGELALALGQESYRSALIRKVLFLKGDGKPGFFIHGALTICALPHRNEGAHSIMVAE